MHEQAQAELQAQAESLRTELSTLTVQWEALCRETGASAMRQAYAAALDNQSKAGAASKNLARARERLDSYRRQVGGYEMEQLKLHTEAEKLNDALKENQRAASGWAGELKRLNMPVGTDITAELDESQKQLEHISHTLDKMELRAQGRAPPSWSESQRRAAEQNARLEEMQRQRDIKSQQLVQRLEQSKFESVEAAQNAHRPVNRIGRIQEMTLRKDADRSAAYRREHKAPCRQKR